MTHKTLTQNTFAAVAFASLNAMCAAIIGLLAKLLSDHFNPVEMIFTRNILALAILLIIALITRKAVTLKTKRPLAHLTRSMIGTAGIIMGVWAFSIMPLTQATTLFFTQPLFVTLFSIILLKEKVGLIRILAIIAGFAGVFITVGPSGNLNLFQIAIGLSAAILGAGVDTCLRWLGTTEKSSTTVFYFMALGAIATGFYMPFSDLSITNTSWTIAGLAIAFAIVNIIANLAKTQSFRLAEANLITPINFTLIIWAALFDYLFWHTIPTASLIIGATIIIASNLVILTREHKK